MNVTVTDVNDLRKELVVALSADEVSQEESGILNEFRKHAKVPGFRPGKAPDKLIRQRYKKEFTDQLGQRIATKAFKDAVEDKDLKVFNVVSLEGVEDIMPGTDVTVDITVDLQPSFELPNYTGLDTEAPGTDVSDDEVDGAIQNILRQRADFNEVERPVQVGDYVKVSYTGTIDGQPAAEVVPDAPSNKPWVGLENGWEEAGTDEAKQYGVPEIIDALVGMSAKEEKEVSVTFADDFRIEELRGKTATYQVTVHEVRERVLPEMNEDFFKSLNVESEEDLKARLLDDLENRKKQEQQNARRNQVVEQLIEAVDFPLPQSAIEIETQNVMGRIMTENLQRGVPQEEFEQNKEALHAQSANIATRDVKLQFILNRIAEKESIEVTQEDLQQAVMNMAMQRRQAPGELVQELQKNPEQIRSIQRQLLLGKTLDFIVKQANLTVKEGGSESA